MAVTANLVNPSWFGGGFATQPSSGSGWTHRMSITIPAAQVFGTQTNFDSLIDLSTITDNAFWDNVKTDGGDLRITQEDGITEQPLWVRLFNKGANTGLVHFKYTVQSSSDTVAYLYWGKAAATLYAVGDALGRNNVFNSIWSAAWFLDVVPTTPFTIPDVTGSGANGSAGTFSGDTAVAGKFGGAFDFDGTNHAITITDIAGLNANPESAQWAVVRMPDLVTQTPLAGAITTNMAWILRATVSGATLRAVAQLFDGTTTYTRTGTSDLLGSAWHSMFYGYDKVNFFVGADGVIEHTAALGSHAARNPSSTRIGSMGTANSFRFKGDLNEVRYSSKAGIDFSDRYKTMHNNYFSMASFIVEGATEVAA